MQLLRDLIVNTSLWMASAPTLNDPFDSHIEHRWNLTGAEARRAWTDFLRLTFGISKAKAAALVPTDYVADPAKTRKLLNDTHQDLAAHVGVCSLSSTPRNVQLWSYYGGSSQGIVLQYAPALDPAGLFARKIIYTPDPVVVDGFGLQGDLKIFNLLQRKGIDWQHEREWRLLDPAKSDYVRSLRPEALTGLILGLRVEEEGVALVRALLDERRSRRLPMPKLYRVVKPPRGQRLRIVSFTA